MRSDRAEAFGVRHRWVVAPLLVVGVLLLVVGPAAGGVTGPTATASPSQPHWSIVSSPDTSIDQNDDLHAVSCISATQCFAVGYSETATAFSPLIEEFDGTGWSIVSSPQVLPSADLTGVSCTSATFCMAVGGSGPKNGEGATLTEEWNGAVWSIVPSPDTGDSYGDDLQSVSCVSSFSCTAVGESTTNQTDVTLAERWDGSSWSIAPTPNPSTYINQLLRVSCSSANACMAVGTDRSLDGIDQNLIESWNGGSWSVDPSPEAGGAVTNLLDGVSCPTVTWCTAVGSYAVGSGFDPLIQTWNGTAWSIATSPTVGGALYAVSCTSVTSCVAVGYVKEIESWNGTAWSVDPAPANSASYPGSLTGVSCVVLAGCSAVGSYRSNTSPNQQQTLAEEGGPPTVVLTAEPVPVDPKAGGTLQVKAEVGSPAALTGAKLSVTIAPAVNLSVATQQHVSVAIGSVPANTPVEPTVPSVAVAPVVAADGTTIPGMNSWSAASNGWQATTPASVTPGGGDLVFSDSPEYIASTTVTKGGIPGGNGVEGVLYRESGCTYATSSTSCGAFQPDFRVYLNHENRTTVEKSICVVVSNPSAGPVALVRSSEGVAETYGDPVKAGKLALIQYEDSRRASDPITVTIPAKGAVASCPGSIGNKGTAQVVNAIIDLSASSPVQVGVVAVDTSRVAAFTADPLTFHFADAAFPNGDPSRTYRTDTPLSNPTEHGHVHGTFPYDELTVVLPAYNADSGVADGVRLGDKPTMSPGEYVHAIDNSSFDSGNFGVFYDVSVPTVGVDGEATQVLLNPRGVGKSGTVTNGYAGVVDVPAPPDGSVPIGPPIDTPAGAVNLTDKDLGIGIGQVTAPNAFSFEFMPPGGSTLPLAVVTSPAYVTVEATLTYNSGATVQAAPIEVRLTPTGG
jgi:hypothetical protein